MESSITVEQIEFRGETRYNVKVFNQTVAWNLYLNDDGNLMADTFGAELDDSFFGADLVCPEGEALLEAAEAIIGWSIRVGRF